MPYSGLPAPARAIAEAVDAAVSAARTRERAPFAAAITDLSALDPERVSVVLGSVVQVLMEQAHPDGLAADDVEQLFGRILAATRPWYGTDPDLLLIVVAGALGMQEPGTEPAGTRHADVTAHAVLLVAQVLDESGEPLGRYVGAALGEIARAETMEMP